MLDGNLPRNQVETNDLTQYLMASGIRPGDSHERPTFDWSLFLEELCDVETDAEGAWDKNQWYCTDCILGLIKLRLRIWWIARKIRGACFRWSALINIDWDRSRQPTGDG